MLQTLLYNLKWFLQVFPKKYIFFYLTIAINPRLLERVFVFFQFYVIP